MYCCYDVNMVKILIKEVMEKKNIKADSIVSNLSFSRATAYRILKGEKNPTIDDLEEFAEQLDVYLEDLYQSERSRR